MSVKTFEEKRYRKRTPPTWRHRITSHYVREGTILDMGCGDGKFLKLLPKKVKHLGIDLSTRAIAQCKKEKLNARVLDFDGCKLPFKAKQFDTIIMLDVLEHLYQPQETLREARRIGKTLILVVPNFSSATARLQVLFGAVPENNKPKRGHVQWITHSVLIKWLKDTGWSVQELESNHYLQQLPIINIITKLLGSLFPSLFTTAFMVSAK